MAKLGPNHPWKQPWSSMRMQIAPEEVPKFILDWILEEFKAYPYSDRVIEHLHAYWNSSNMFIRTKMDSRGFVIAPVRPPPEIPILGEGYHMTHEKWNQLMNLRAILEDE